MISAMNVMTLNATIFCPLDTVDPPPHCSNHAGLTALGAMRFSFRASGLRLTYRNVTGVCPSVNRVLQESDCRRRLALFATLNSFTEFRSRLVHFGAAESNSTVPRAETGIWRVSGRL